MPRSREEHRNVIKTMFSQVEEMARQRPGDKGNCVFLEQKVYQCVSVCACVRVHVCASLFEFIDDDREKPQSMNLEISKDQIT